MKSSVQAENKTAAPGGGATGQGKRSCDYTILFWSKGIQLDGGFGGEQLALPIAFWTVQEDEPSVRQLLLWPEGV